MKQELRNYFKTQRNNIDSQTRADFSKKAIELFLSSDLYKSAKTIMIYIPIGKETDTQEIINKCFEDNKTLLLPVTDTNSFNLDAVLYTKQTTLEKGAFSVMEPKNKIVVNKSTIDLVIVPGVAFSQKGARIGYGKGCYDRFLKGMSAIKVGLCYDFQLTALIKPDTHDEEMNYIITDKKIYNCKERKSYMKANYHTHTYYCHHAINTPREYVENAINNGLEILGFSDHNPCPFTNGFTSDYRINLESTKSYIDEIKSLRDEFKYKIKILIGYETEYYPAEFETTMNFIRQFECDYMILGQHFTNNGYDGIYSGSTDITESDLIDYVNQIIEGINKGVFSYIAHPDLIRYRGDEEIYNREITRLLNEAKALSIPVEFNLLGFMQKRPYPYKKFWELVKIVGNDVIIGCDAHESINCANPEIYSDAIKELKKFQLTPIDYLTLKEV